MWFRQISKDSDVVISSRIRLARNLDGYKFPHMLSEKESNEIIDILSNNINKKEYDAFKIKDIDEITKYSLIEQYLISKEFIKKINGGIILNKDNSIVTMINEEDNLRIQAFESGFNLDKCYEKIFGFTNSLEEKIKFAKSDKYGYLTACPTNVGSGIRVSVMMHLPGLEKIKLLPKIFDEIINIGVSVRGIYGENTEGIASMYQISNQKTLGISDEVIISNMKVIINSIIEEERKARQILKNNSIYLEDEVYRAYGILKNARYMSEEEAIELLSILRLGVTLDLIPEVTLQKVQMLLVDIKPHTLKIMLKENFTKEEEKIKRSEYIREELN